MSYSIVRTRDGWVALSNYDDSGGGSVTLVVVMVTKHDEGREEGGGVLPKGRV